VLDDELLELLEICNTLTHEVPEIDVRTETVVAPWRPFPVLDR
jgi:hypothetical protein